LVKVEWTEKAVKDLEKLDQLIARRIVRKISWLMTTGVNWIT